MEKFPLKGSREAAAEGNSYITAYQTVMKKSNGHTSGAGAEGEGDANYHDHPLAPLSKLTTSLTAPATDDEDMIDITPRSSPGDVIGGGGGSSSGGYHRETATESDTERDFAHAGNHHNQRTMHHHHHQHVPTHSAFGDPMDAPCDTNRSAE